jgi:hypothetical protein
MMTMNIVPCTSARLQATLGTFNANYWSMKPFSFIFSEAWYWKP